MRSEKEIREIRDLAWKIADELIDKDCTYVGNEFTTVAMTLDWVLGEDEWPHLKFLKRKLKEKEKKKAED